MALYIPDVSLPLLPAQKTELHSTLDSSERLRGSRSDLFSTIINAFRLSRLENTINSPKVERIKHNFPSDCYNAKQECEMYSIRVRRNVMSSCQSTLWNYLLFRKQLYIRV